MALTPKPNRPASDGNKPKGFIDATKIADPMDLKSKSKRQGDGSSKKSTPLPSRIIPERFNKPYLECKTLADKLKYVQQLAFSVPRVHLLIEEILNQCKTRDELREARSVIDLIGPILSQNAYIWRRDQRILREMYVKLIKTLPSKDGSVKEQSGDKSPADIGLDDLIKSSGPSSSHGGGEADQTLDV